MFITNIREVIGFITKNKRSYNGCISVLRQLQQHDKTVIRHLKARVSVVEHITRYDNVTTRHKQLQTITNGYNKL